MLVVEEYISEWKYWLIYISIFRLVKGGLYPPLDMHDHEVSISSCVACLATWYIFCYMAKHNNFGQFFQIELLQYVQKYSMSVFWRIFFSVHCYNSFLYSNDMNCPWTWMGYITIPWIEWFLLPLLFVRTDI